MVVVKYEEKSVHKFALKRMVSKNQNTLCPDFCEI